MRSDCSQRSAVDHNQTPVSHLDSDSSWFEVGCVAFSELSLLSQVAARRFPVASCAVNLICTALPAHTPACKRTAVAALAPRPSARPPASAIVESIHPIATVAALAPPPPEFSWRANPRTQGAKGFDSCRSPLRIASVLLVLPIEGLRVCAASHIRAMGRKKINSCAGE
ncbi:hypothetical protein L1887_57371 [Cichorium endivia]|nr:hypothetical protein L1887_57371 [Cichorium endivia]